MTTSGELRARGTLAGVLAGILVLGLALPPASASGARSIRRRMLELTNTAREAHGLRPLDLGFRLSRRAEAHSLDMARRRLLFHSGDVSSLLPRSWRAWGENVGYTGGRPRDLQRAFMRSPSHRRNVLYRAFDKVGIGVAVRADLIWVTLIFFG